MLSSFYLSHHYAIETVTGSSKSLNVILALLGYCLESIERTVCVWAVERNNSLSPGHVSRSDLHSLEALLNTILTLKGVGRWLSESSSYCAGVKVWVQVPSIDVKSNVAVYSCNPSTSTGRHSPASIQSPMWKCTAVIPALLLADTAQHPVKSDGEVYIYNSYWQTQQWTAKDLISEKNGRKGLAPKFILWSPHMHQGT